MATYPANSLNWWLEIDRNHADYLRPIRHWSHLSIARGPDVCWVKGLRPDDPMSREIRSIPYKRLLYQRNDRLFPAGGLVPVRRIDGDLEWMSLEKGLPLRLPSFNHNYFGISERLKVRLAASSKEQPAAAMLIGMDILRSYAKTASAVRFNTLSWCLVDGEALVLGSPQLPVPGESYWLRTNHLLPAGWDLEFPILAENVITRWGNAGSFLVFWDRDGHSTPIDVRDFRPLSLGSIRLT